MGAPPVLLQLLPFLLCWNQCLFLLEPETIFAIICFDLLDQTKFCYYRILILLEVAWFFATTVFWFCNGGHFLRPATATVAIFATTVSFFCCNRQPQKIQLVNIFATMVPASF